MNASKTWLWVLIVLAALALFLVAWNYGVFNRPVIKKEAPLSSGDTTAEIDNDLNAVDFGNPDEDLKQLDNDLNNL